MARVASRRQPCELSGCRIFVAVVAGQHCMRTDQWKTVLMIFDGIQRNLPAFYRVAALAIGAKLAAMHVGVAIGTVSAHLLEHQVCVAFHASDFLVHAAQGITGLIVIELRIRPDRLPTCIGVTVLTRRRDWAVRVAHFGLWTANLGSTIVLWLLHCSTGS